MSSGSHLALRLPAWIGDAVMAEPLVRAACDEQARRGGTTRLIGPEHVLELFESRFAGVARITLARGERESVAVYRGADAALLLNGSWSSAWMAARARVPLRAGFATRGRRMLLTHPLVPPFERGGTPRGLGSRGAWPRVLPRPFSAACRELGALLAISVSDTAPRLEPSARGVELARARAVVAGDEPFVLVHAGARADSAKGFPAQRWSALVDALEVAGLPRCVLACAPGEEPAARATFAGQRARRTVLLDAPPAGIAELIAWSTRATLVITPDNGARHVAQALGRPVVVLFGPTDPRHTAEHAGNVRGVRVDVDCGPCHAERCPLPGPAEHACMRRIETATIVELARAACADARRPRASERTSARPDPRSTGRAR